jgi:prevent-host-death family protein
MEFTMNAIFKTQILPVTAAQTPIPPDWQLQEAKNRFSQVVRAARDGVPQWVTVHGKRAAVVLSAEAFEALQHEHNSLAAKAEPAPKMSLLEALRMDLPENGLTDEDIDNYFGRNRTLDVHRRVDL